mgnify:CR=1 FL=1
MSARRIIFLPDPRPPRIVPSTPVSPTRRVGMPMAFNSSSTLVAMNPGAENASVDHFTIRIQGRSAHVSTPELGADALYAAAQIVTALQSIVGRLKNPTDPALIGVGVLPAPRRAAVWASWPQACITPGH